MMDKAIGVGGAFVFSLFIIFDTHMLMLKNAYSKPPNDIIMLKMDSHFI
jgi:FtsH-binding integral membrane protein